VGDVNVGGSAVQVAVGQYHTCAVLTSGSVRCWGLGNSGQLGYGNGNWIGDNELPSSAGDVNVGGPVVQVAAGGLHTCALLSTGAVRCWGENSARQLGYYDGLDIALPASAGDVPLAP
jgi:alpha-tubulin suppressor-like RCC1 family protein